MYTPRYGLNDSNNSPNCNTATVSCGFFSNPGYNAAVSQNLYGAASGRTPICGTCWRLHPVSDPNAPDPSEPVAGLEEIVVKVNNLCPAAGNERDVSCVFFFVFVFFMYIFGLLFVVDTVSVFLSICLFIHLNSQ